MEGGREYPAGELTVTFGGTVLSLMDLLVRKPDPRQQNRETRIAPDGVEEPGNAGENKEGLLLLPGHLQVAESVVRISQSYVEKDKALRRDELPLGLREQLLENLPRLGEVPAASLNVTDNG